MPWWPESRDATAMCDVIASDVNLSLFFRKRRGNPFACSLLGKSNGGFLEGGISNNRFVLKPDVAIASEVPFLSKNSLAITDFHAKKTQHVQLFENPLPGTPPFAIPNSEITGSSCENLAMLACDAKCLRIFQSRVIRSRPV